MLLKRSSALHGASLATAAAAFALAAPTARAVEFGYVRPLQTGTIGDSPQFTELGKYEAEGALSIYRSFGKYTRNADPETKVSGSAVRSHVMAGGGMMPTKTFGLTINADITIASDADENQTRQAPKAELDTGMYRHSGNIFAFYKANNFVLGGGLGLLVVGSETREFKYNGNDYTQEITSAAMPVMQIFGGLATKQFDGTLGVRFFSMGEAVVSAQDPTHQKYEYDIVRRNPAEIHADAKLKLGQAAIAGSVAYVLTGQASEQIDEFSLNFEQVGDTKERDQGGARRNKDHLKIGAGARWDPVKLFGIMGGLGYETASYAKEEYASLEHENLGGFRIDLGTEVNIQKFRGVFTAGYTLDSSASWTQKDTSRSEIEIDATQRSPINKGDKVKMTQGNWLILLGGGIVL